jgi:branched-chain amino acid transport system permease protein
VIPQAVVERRTRASLIAAVAFVPVLILLALVPVLFVDSVVRTLLQFLYLLALAQMWNLLAGFAGLVSIGQQAYVGLGGYGVLYLADTLGVNVFLAVFLAALVAGLLAIPTAALVFRLRGGYFAIGTWVVAEVYRLVVANTDALGGGSGATISSAVRVAPGLRQMVTYWIALGVGVGSVLVVFLVLRSRLGLALRAVGDREVAASTLGVDVLRTKFKVYVLASAMTGLTGAVIYLALLRLQPTATFSVNWSAFMIFAVVIGGLGSISGPIVGTALYVALQHYLADLGSTYLILLGAVAVAVMLKAPRGLWGLITARWDVDPFPVSLRVRAGPSAGEGGAPATGSKPEPEPLTGRGEERSP